MLRELPHSTANLFHASWALHCLAEGEFDPVGAKAFLERRNLVKQPIAYPHILKSFSDPMDALDEFLDFKAEIDIIVERYAESVNAIMETFVNPDVEIQPITLSGAEYARISEAFLILKLYYQFQLKFKRAEKFGDGPFTWEPDFTSCLYPWQVEQVLSVDWFLQSYGHTCSSAFYGLISEWYSSQERLEEESSYFRHFKRAISNVEAYYPANPHFVPFRLAARYFSSMAPWRLNSEAFDSPTQGPSEELLGTTENTTPSHGWIYFKSVRQPHQIPEAIYGQLFLELGIFFWDQDRLAEWNLADPNEFKDVLVAFETRQHQAGQYYAFMSQLDYESFLQRRESDRIIEWTRCPIQGTFGAWGLEKIRLGHFLADLNYEKLHRCG
ncbi:uncharacterized protein BDR25DRAFT_306939 [Lindgomyces ingoldianus]|uniref:Uncharacterized protein n=1 Tax=Lindgomyces ingoldianus TaxID=673940 RepID=A0ACB6QD28_9PLEO|nr:uncharacterized protein BDR25DRAFT_306939 [Lindgomyces ingoldianus]KAF2464821.1 hypothetical protein BDR25DRAFT_306939 [Lindgomyces ingoldianus]